MKALNELSLAKRRLNDLEESKTGLALEVKNLKEQLSSFQSTHSIQIHNPSNNCPNCRCSSSNNMVKDLNNQWNTDNQTNSNNRYDRDFFNDTNNHAVKIILKEKETRESQLQTEIKILQEKFNESEKDKDKIKNEFNECNLRLKDTLNESEKCARYLRSCEEQLDMSEKKREELIYEAQETIKL
jgi:hypothetical protein